MALYSAAVLTSSGTATTPVWDIKATSTDSPKIMEVGCSLGATGGMHYGLGRPGNDGGVVQTSATTVQADNPNDPAGQSTCAATWSTAPTVPTTYLRRIDAAAIIGAGVIWTFPRGLTITPLHGLVLWCIVTSSATSYTNVSVDE